MTVHHSDNPRIQAYFEAEQRASEAWAADVIRPSKETEEAYAQAIYDRHFAYLAMTQAECRQVQDYLYSLDG